jgi:hypothetical protein
MILTYLSLASMNLNFPPPNNPLGSLTILSSFDIVSYRRRMSGLFTSITLFKAHFLKGMIEPQE